ncbi:DUF6090 family protein [Aureibaculum conchae]|uniref:DUF6090 family protein n=1 Tax=Aureibaculum sp. 2308TA14-22 TaxID=3108392 RepID=UPI003391E2BA
MSKFFRSKLPKTITYFLGEILIVVLGIFIAVQLNNWNENIKDRKEEKKSLELLLNELNYEKFTVDYSDKELKKSIAYLTQIKNGNYSKIDSLTNKLDNEYIKQKINSSYINMKFSGKLNLISNDTLKSIIARHYEIYYEYFGNFEKSQRAFIHNNVRPYILKELNLSSDSISDNLKIIEKLKDQELQNLISYQIDALTSIDKALDPSYLEQTIQYVEKELAKFD